jgi:hypothetical protein
VKRRGFLKLLGLSAAAAPAAPAMAVASVADLGLDMIGVEGRVPHAEQLPSAYLPIDQQVQDIPSQLATLIGRTAEQHRFWARRQDVYGLDPDLASYRSMSLGFRIEIQRQRNYERGVNNRMGWLEAHIKGWMDP